MASLVRKVSSAVAACARRLTRRLQLRARGLQLQQRGGSGVCFGWKLALADGGGGKDDDDDGDREKQSGQGKQVALWRRAILMGQRCEPLDFPGAVHYDSFGRRVQSPRSGSSSRKAAGALLCRSSDAIDVDDAAVAAAAKKA